MNIETAPIRYCAISMELAAYLDGHYVEMHILTDTGKTVSIVCQRDSIYSVQRHIERMAEDCPEIATWKPTTVMATLDNKSATPRAGRWARAAGNVIAGVIALAVGPATFWGVDHVIVVRWSNKILDLVSGS